MRSLELQSLLTKPLAKARMIPSPSPTSYANAKSRQLIDQLARLTSEARAIETDRDTLLIGINIASASVSCGLEPQMTLREMSKLVTGLRTRFMKLKLNLATASMGPASLIAKAEQLQESGQWLPMNLFGDYYKLKTGIGELERDCFKVQLLLERAYRINNGFRGETGKHLLIPEPYIHEFVKGEFPDLVTEFGKVELD